MSPTNTFKLSVHEEQYSLPYLSSRSLNSVILDKCDQKSSHLNSIPMLNLLNPGMYIFLSPRQFSCPESRNRQKRIITIAKIMHKKVIFFCGTSQERHASHPPRLTSLLRFLKKIATSLSADIGPIWVHNRDTFSTQFFVWEKVGTFSVPGAFRDAEDVASP